MENDWGFEVANLASNLRCVALGPDAKFGLCSGKRGSWNGGQKEKQGGIFKETIVSRGAASFGASRMRIVAERRRRRKEGRGESRAGSFRLFVSLEGHEKDFLGKFLQQQGRILLSPLLPYFHFLWRSTSFSISLQKLLPVRFLAAAVLPLKTGRARISR